MITFPDKGMTVYVYIIPVLEKGGEEGLFAW